MKTLKKTLKWIGIIFLVLVATGFTLYLIYLRPVMQKMQQTNVIKYDKELTIILGGGGNSGILVSDSLVIVIDTKMDDAAERLSKTVKELAGNKPILVINTHYHSDHCKGNKYFKGQNILAGANYTKEIWIKEASEETLPTQWLKGKMDIKMGDDTVTIFNLDRNAHTASDVFVYLHKRKMLFGGDVILNKQAPALLGVADMDGYMEAFDMLPKQFDIVKIVPGHGPMGGIEIMENFRQYFNDMKIAAKDDSKKDELVAKYNDWVQVPFIMSPGATINAIKKKASIK
ncbi:MAG TPA: MBL fold metallo-hydrolase [Cytophagaceae bacterium]|jgi:glyoxylase-like metal-dependent hydrolase (beta-lactamase superfamily II)|nr:MBL fold metallo-hydrolase [Cytophagaceae bacterium]